MSAKDLFKSTATVISNKSLSDLTSSHSLESVEVIPESLLRDDFLLPNVDFTDPAQFAKYGLAEKYYEDSIKKIWQTYPWDGSRKQKMNWRNNSSFLDLHIFDNEYPKETGSITIGTTFGTASVKSNGFYSTPSRVEYIKIGPGLSSGSVYSSSDRTSAFSFNSEDGFCVEFYMKADTWSPDLATASYQCIFDMGARDEDTASPIAFSSMGAYRFSILTKGTTLTFHHDDATSDQYINYNNAVEYSKWNRFSINVRSGTLNGTVDVWKNGTKIVSNNNLYTIGKWPFIPVDFAFSGTIGAFSSVPLTYIYVNQWASLGWNKFSGSLDDFRFWRRTRTDKEIQENWFTTVDGGFNNDELLNPDMGFYYKFNEGITFTSSQDAIVKDYSGRNNDAIWVGYTAAGRSTKSPIVNEIGDPVIYSSSYRVQELLTNKQMIGKDYDFNNNSALINNLPAFLNDEDDSEHLENLTQIIGSYFDKLWLQIGALTTMKDTAYFASGSLSSEILKVAIQSNGIQISNILDNITLSELVSQKYDDFTFEQSIESVKRVIYKNIYNNLIYIYKSKGTEKAVKSVFRAFGVDDEVLKIKAYSNSKFEIDGSKRYETVRRKNYLDLSGQTDAQNLNGVVFNHYTASQSGSIGFFSMPEYRNDAARARFAYPRTVEVNVVIPTVFDQLDPNYIYIANSQYSSSLFGFYEMPEMGQTGTSTTWQTNGFNFNAFVVRKNKHSQDGKFVFNCRAPAEVDTISNLTLETSWFPDVYKNSKWTFAVKIYPTGSVQGVPRLNRYESVQTKFGPVFEITALHELAGQIIHTYSYRTMYTASTFAPFVANTACYLGALRTNFTGTVQMQTNAKFGSMRVWQDYLSDQDTINHALDIESFGTSRIFESVNGESTHPNSVLNAGYDALYFPKIDACVMNWDFEKEYIPNASGQFLVHSVRGNSIYSQSTQPNVAESNYTGLGYGFNSNSTVIEKGYAIEQKNRELNNLVGLDSVQILDDYDEFFDSRVRPTEYFYTVENSVYAVVSEEILNFFSSIDDFNNLIGEPVLQYRQKYKAIDVLRHVFFSKLNQSKIDVNKYLSYYNWLDGAISSILRSLFPASADADSGLRNVIESHVLERNKHIWPYRFIKNNPNFELLGIIQSIRNKSIRLHVGANEAVVDPERHALQFDGLVDIAYVQGGATGYGTTYALVLKMATLPTTNAGWPVPGHLSVSAAGVFPNNVTEAWQLQAGSPNQYRHVGVTSAGAVSFSRTSGGAGQSAGAQVHLIGRDTAANLARARIVKASDQSIFWGPTDAATSEDSAPDDIIIGGYGAPNRTLHSSPCDILFVALVFLDIIPTDADLQAYSAPTCRDARSIANWAGHIKSYICASSLLPGDTSIAALVGTPPLTLVGPAYSDLVSL